MKLRLGIVALTLAGIYLLARQAKISADQNNVQEVHPWVFQQQNPAQESLSWVLLDYDFKDVDRCILQATAVRRGKNTVLRLKCLKLP